MYSDRYSFSIYIERQPNLSSLGRLRSHKLVLISARNMKWSLNSNRIRKTESQLAPLTFDYKSKVSVRPTNIDCK